MQINLINRGKPAVSSYQIEETRELLLKIWSVLLLGLLWSRLSAREDIGDEQTLEAAEEILPDIAKLLFFALMFVSFLVDIVEMRADKNKAYRFLLLSLLLGGISATISAMQYHVWAWLFWGITPLARTGWDWVECILQKDKKTYT